MPPHMSTIVDGVSGEFSEGEGKDNCGNILENGPERTSSPKTPISLSVSETRDQPMEADELQSTNRVKEENASVDETRSETKALDVTVPKGDVKNVSEILPMEAGHNGGEIKCFNGELPKIDGENGAAIKCETLVEVENGGDTKCVHDLVPATDEHRGEVKLHHTEQRSKSARSDELEQGNGTQKAKRRKTATASKVFNLTMIKKGSPPQRMDVETLEFGVHVEKNHSLPNCKLVGLKHTPTKSQFTAKSKGNVHCHIRWAIGSSKLVHNEFMALRNVTYTTLVPPEIP